MFTSKGNALDDRILGWPTYFMDVADLIKFLERLANTDIDSVVDAAERYSRLYPDYDAEIKESLKKRMLR